MDTHVAVGAEQGLNRDQIDAALAVTNGSELPRREQLALEYSDRASATPVDVSDEFFAELRQEFSDAEIVEITAHIAHENYNAKTNRPLRVEPNGFCTIPLSLPTD